jgi:hypothetical protein
MPFRNLSSIEFQGSYSRDLNLGQSDNCIFEIYDQYTFCQCLSRTSLILSGEVKSRYFQLSIRKNVKVNITRFRILCSIELQGPLLQKLEFSRSEIVLLESTVNTLSVDASYLHN